MATNKKPGPKKSRKLSPELKSLFQSMADIAPGCLTLVDYQKKADTIELIHLLKKERIRFTVRLLNDGLALVDTDPEDKDSDVVRVDPVPSAVLAVALR